MLEIKVLSQGEEIKIEVLNEIQTLLLGEYGFRETTIRKVSNGWSIRLEGNKEKKEEVK